MDQNQLQLETCFWGNLKASCLPHGATKKPIKDNPRIPVCGFLIHCRSRSFYADRALELRVARPTTTWKVVSRKPGCCSDSCASAGIFKGRRFSSERQRHEKQEDLEEFLDGPFP